MTPILATFLWLADKFGKDAIESGVQLGWDAARWQRAADQYADKIERDYGWLPLFGKDEYVPIDDIYTYVHVLDRHDAYFQFAEDRLSELYVRRDLHYDPDTRRDGWRLVADGEHLFILGDPGAGKTTFLKMAAIKAARGELRRKDDAPERIPIFIALRQHGRTQRSLYESVKHELNVCGFPETDLIVDALLRSGRALLLWDALDEVATDEDQRSILVAEMHDFMRKYDRCQYVISCRIAAADYTFHERRLRYVKMAPFSDNQIERYLKNWFGDKHALAADCVEELKEERHKGLCELARTPILLTLLAIAYEETLSFPSRRVDIYYQAIEALLRKWDADRGIRRGQEVYAGLELGYKWDLMTEVAADAFNNGEYLLTRQEWGDRIRDYLEALPGISPGVDGGLVLDDMAARHGLFVQQTPRLYSLPHLSFQEYFTARDIKENIQHGSLERLLDHMGEDQWREIFLLTASSLRRKDAETFFDLFVIRLESMTINTVPIQQNLLRAQCNTVRTVNEMNSTYRPVSLRAWFLDEYCLPGDLPISVCRTVDNAIALDPNLALDCALDRAINRVAAIEQCLGTNRIGSIWRIRFGADIAIFTLAIDDAKAMCVLMQLVGLHDALDKLAIPVSDDVHQEWYTFQEYFETIIEDMRDLSSIRSLQKEAESDKKRTDETMWNSDQLVIYEEYLHGTALLMDCLKLATVANRREIEERLLLPANSAEDA